MKYPELKCLLLLLTKLTELLKTGSKILYGSYFEKIKIKSFAAKVL